MLGRSQEQVNAEWIAKGAGKSGSRGPQWGTGSRPGISIHSGHDQESEGEDREESREKLLRSYQSIGSPVKAFVIDTVMVSACNSPAAACDIMSHMSSFAALGNAVSCSMNGSAHAALRLRNQSPACHSAAAENIRAVFPPWGLISITPGMLTLRR